MRILTLTSTLPRFHGDIQADFVGEQARAWLSARPDDQITILAPHDSLAQRREKQDRLQIARFRYFLPESWQALAYPAILPNVRRNPLLALQILPFLLAQAHSARKIVRSKGIDLIYAHWVMPQGLVALWLKKRLGVPYILQTHSSDLAIFNKASKPGRSLARSILRESSHFFCVNSSQLELALSYLPCDERKSFAAKSSVLPMGVAEIAPVSSKQVVFDIGTIGRLSRKKGLDLLIAAAESLASDGIKPRIAIAGDGEEAAKLKSLVKLADIHFPGFLVGEAKEAYLNSCARFAFPAKAAGDDVEGMPVALLEAMMRGQSVLASTDTNIAMLPEWPLIKDDLIFVRDPANINELILGIQELLARAPGSAQTAASVLARYRWDRLIEEYLVAIETALAC